MNYDSFQTKFSYPTVLMLSLLYSMFSFQVLTVYGAETCGLCGDSGHKGNNLLQIGVLD